MTTRTAEIAKTFRALVWAAAAVLIAWKGTAVPVAFIVCATWYLIDVSRRGE